MNIALHVNAKLPVSAYGGTERVVWGLGKALARAGHNVTLMALKGSKADFGRVIELDPQMPIGYQIPPDVDIVHFQNVAPYGLERPYVVTVHGNMPQGVLKDPYAIYVSSNHAHRHGASSFVYNGLDWDDYPPFRHDLRRDGCFFLGKAAWKVKNIRGAIRIAAAAGEKLDVLGGYRLNFKMGFRFTLDKHVRFHGMVDNIRKGVVANKSKGLIFPVLWDEPFGLAVVESLYFGAPVFATPHGSIPELVLPEFGVLSEDENVLANALRTFDADSVRCHEYAADMFNADIMASNYIKYYERRLNNLPFG